jgi:RsiW-degrading membrane proteinase PrsW (M82 family)
MTLRILSWLGIGIPAVTLLIAMPALFATGGGASTVLGNAAEACWVLVLIALAVAPVRTIGGKAVAGAWFAGFFGVLSLATLIGRPIVARFGTDSVFAVAIWAPVTEELAKLLPVVLFLLLATRSSRVRPSAGDALLFGATVGAGFAVYENTLYARAFGGFGGNPPLSLLVPTLQSNDSMLVGGHLVYTGLTALGLGVALAYRRRHHLAWLAAPLTFAVAVTEHITANALSVAETPSWVTLTRILTLNGYLSSLLLIAGVATVAIVERRSLRRAGLAATGIVQTLRPRRLQLAGRAAALACVQCGPQPPEVRS